ncbi:MAG: hypothetical protein ACK4YQ_08260 [Phenylobacterium sp.]|uniref:phage adaptor protein n=1 Tax=Phenylobacterium sp. TaxID=1871053 RepID=UPI003918E3DD
MTLSTYTDLKSAVADWLDRADLNARIPDFVALAEAQMNRTLRVRRMIARASASLEAEFTSLPGDFLEVVALTGDDGQTLRPAPPQTMAALKAASPGPGRPQRYALAGEALQVHPAPERPVGVALTYYAKIPALSASVAANWLLAEAPDAYLYGALLQAAPYLRDPEALPIWNAGYEAALAGVRAGQATQAGPLQAEPGLQTMRALSSTAREF